MKLKNGGLFRRGCFKRASGGPIFSASPEKMGRKALGYGLVRTAGRFLIYSCYECTNSPYGRYGTRRLLRYPKLASSYV